MNRDDYDKLAKDHAAHQAFGEVYRADCATCKPKPKRPLKGDFCPNCGPVELKYHFACDAQLDEWEGRL